MLHAIFYKPDGSFAGSNPVNRNVDIQSEASKWGAGYRAILVDDVPTLQRGKKFIVDNGILKQIPDPDQENMIQKKRVVLDLVKQRLILTDDQMQLLFGGGP